MQENAFPIAQQNKADTSFSR